MGGAQAEGSEGQHADADGDQACVSAWTCCVSFHASDFGAIAPGDWISPDLLPPGATTPRDSVDDDVDGVAIGAVQMVADVEHLAIGAIGDVAHLE